MGLIDDVKIYAAVKKMLVQTKQEAITVIGTKPGWQTSEFWLTLITNLVGVLGMAKGIVPPQYQGYIAVALIVLNGVYTTARTLIKNQGAMTATTTVGPATVTTTTTKP
jgi:hypothetical protein